VQVNKVLSFGNGAVLHNEDWLEYFAGDPDTKYIAMYVEGVRDGQRFFRLLRETARRKPVVLWKGGLTEAGARATASHTASLASSTQVWNALCRQAGAIQSSSLHETIDLLKALAMLPTLAGDGIALTGGAGGQSVSMTDAFSLAGLRIPRLSQRSYDRLGEWFSLVGASYQNPIDLGSNREELDQIFDLLEQDSNIDCIVTQVRPPSEEGDQKRMEEQLSSLERARERNTKPLVVVLHSPRAWDDAAAAKQVDERLRACGIPAFASYERAAVALRKTIDYNAAVAAGR
jgi:acyl-CoA synthetase (NDP forming)